MSEIILNSYEIASYWWLKIIRNKTKELYAKENRSDDEELFFDIFKNLSEIDYREIYLKLSKMIYQDIYNLEKKDLDNDNNMFYQDTSLCGHNTLNKELSIILNIGVPDIKLSSSMEKDYRLYIDFDKCYLEYQANDLKMLSNRYNENYILTGEIEFLKLYYTLLATLKEIEQQDIEFNNVKVLRERFSSIYISYYELDIDINLMYEMFNNEFNLLYEREYIVGRSFNETYLLNINNLELINLSNYEEVGKFFADKILNNEKVLKKV